MRQKSNDELFEFKKIGNRAVKKAQKENLKSGIPNVYSRDKKIYYEYPEEESEKKKPPREKVVTPEQ